VPGGAKGADTIANHLKVQRMLQTHYEQGKLVGMICAGSLAAKKAGVGKGGKITSHPSVKAELQKGTSDFETDFGDFGYEVNVFVPQITSILRRASLHIKI